MAEEKIKEAEASKARILSTPGKQSNLLNKGFEVLVLPNQAVNVPSQGSNVDDNYILVGAHLETSLKDKICKGEYVDFARLLPWERQSYDDHRFELVNHGSQTFFILASDREGNNSISSLHRWEQAFRVFSNVYLKAFLDKATELIQYNHIICAAAASFTWDNVYNYDHEFRAHIGNYPDRNWGIILQQAWSMCLKDRNNFNHRQSSSKGQSKGKKEICQRFNKGLCTACRSCKYDHRCFGCGKFGHGIHICHQKMLIMDWICIMIMQVVNSTLGHQIPHRANNSSCVLILVIRSLFCCGNYHILYRRCKR